MRRVHMCVDIEGFLKNNRRKRIDCFTDNNGRSLSDKEARVELAKLLELGHKLIPTSSECEGFDPFGGGCPGHEVKEDSHVD